MTEHIDDYGLWREGNGPRPAWACQGACGVRAFVTTTLDWDDIPKADWECLNQDEAWPNPFYQAERAGWGPDRSVKVLRSRGDCHDAYEAFDAIKGAYMNDPYRDSIQFIGYTGAEY